MEEGKNDFISVRQGRQIIPIVPHVVRRHGGLAARGLLVEYHANDPLEFPERELLQHNLFLFTGPGAQAEIKSPEFTGTRWIRPGSLWVMPRGSRHGVRFPDKMEGIALAFEPGHFDFLIETAGGKHSFPVVESLSVCPPMIEHLMRALAHESGDPSSEDELGLECIATAIALAMSRHVGAVQPSNAVGPRLAPRQMRAVRAYVEGHLSQRITLGDLAGVAGLSSFHFLRGFKGSLMVTPARYVLDRRMERARWLLESSDLSVTEVGIRVGFEELSHFSRAFRRTVGVAPSSFRDSVQQETFKHKQEAFKHKQEAFKHKQGTTSRRNSW